MAREEYALSSRTMSGRVRGRPTRRGTRSRAITSVKAGASPACPAASTKASGRQLPRRRGESSWPVRLGIGRWRGPLVRRLEPPFAGSSCMLMCPNDRGVDGYHPAQALGVVRLGQQGGKQSLPGPDDRPVPQTAVGAFPRAELRRQIHPRRSSPVLPGDRVDHLPVITPSSPSAGSPVRQQGLDPGPLGVGQHTQFNDGPPAPQRLRTQPWTCRALRPTHRRRCIEPSASPCAAARTPR